MYKYKEVKKNHKIIKEFAIRYRKELTVLQGVVCEFNGTISCSDYVKLMNKLSCDEIVGNLLTALLYSDVVELYKQILDGKEDFDVIVNQTLSDNAKLMYYKNISK